MISSCSKDKDTLFKDCLLPWEDLKVIPQAELPKEIVNFFYKTYPKTDTIIGAVLPFCNNEKILAIETEEHVNYDYWLYDSCGELIAKGKTELDAEIRKLLLKSIKKDLGEDADLYDSSIVLYENGKIEYMAEVYIKRESFIYLFAKDGKIICKLF